jgi:hypothetical protein
MACHGPKSARFPRVLEEPDILNFDLCHLHFDLFFWAPSTGQMAKRKRQMAKMRVMSLTRTLVSTARMALPHVPSDSLLQFVEGSRPRGLLGE